MHISMKGETIPTIICLHFVTVTELMSTSSTTNLPLIFRMVSSYFNHKSLQWTKIPRREFAIEKFSEEKYVDWKEEKDWWLGYSLIWCAIFQNAK